jgi:5'-3' exonuclease
MEAEERVRKALEKGEVMADDNAFDSNCITPGNSFVCLFNVSLTHFW